MLSLYRMDKIAYCANVVRLRTENPTMTIDEAHIITRDMYNKSWNIKQAQEQPELPKTFQEKKKAVERFYKLT